MSKRYVLPSALIAGFIWTLSILAFFLYTFPLISNYPYDDGPYLIWNDDPQTTMTIVWHTANPEETEVEYGESLGNMKSFKISTLEKRHVAQLTNLKPGTFYHYKIPDFTSKVFNFTTAPSSTIPFNFSVISDTHASYSGAKYGDLIDVMDNYTYNFIVHGGDLANGDDEAWHSFFNLMERHATTRPYMSVIGNHEYGYADLDIFGKAFKYFFPYDYMEDWGHYYSFDYANAHFVMIDIFQNPLEWPGFLLEAQEAWLRADLAANRDKWLFVVLHEPIYSTGDYNMNPKTIAQLTPIFYENQVDVVFTGHDHHYEAFLTNSSESWGGTYYFVTGGGGGGLDNSIMEREQEPWKTKIHNSSVEVYQHDYWTINNQIYGELTFEFMHFEVNGNNLHIQAIRDNGTLIHEFNIVK